MSVLVAMLIVSPSVERVGILAQRRTGSPEIDSPIAPDGDFAVGRPS
jgi:hypothetical protein